MMTRGHLSLESFRATAANGWVALARSGPRRRWQAAGALALLLAGATALSTREFGSDATAAGTTGARGVASPSSLLAQRSPGDREPGALAQSKPYYALAPSDLVPGFVPSERVLSNERVRTPVGPASPGPAANVAPDPLAALGTPGPLAAVGEPGAASGPGVFPGVPGGGGVGLPGGGGGGGGGGVTTPPDGGTGTTPPDNGGGTTPPDNGGGTTPPGGGTTTPPDNGGGTTPPDNGGGTTPPDNGGGTTPPDNGGGTSPPDMPGPPPPAGAIPEPSTWAMLIVGLFATAGMMRRRRMRDACRISVAR